jgi:hypothetical protein
MRSTMNTLTKAIVAALALCASVPVANAQIVQRTSYIQLQSATAEVDQLIARVVASAYERGYRRVHADARTAMATNAVEGEMKVVLRAGVDYQFAARCDHDCLDLDMVLVDAYGNELKADRDPDATPSFSFRPNRTADYFVRVGVVECTAKRAQIGIVVMAGG